MILFKPIYLISLCILSILNIVECAFRLHEKWVFINTYNKKVEIDMKFKFSIIAITVLLIILFIKSSIETGTFDIIKLLGIIAIAILLFWVDRKLERPVNKASLKRDIKKEFQHKE